MASEVGNPLCGSLAGMLQFGGSPESCDSCVRRRIFCDGCLPTAVCGTAVWWLSSLLLFVVQQLPAEKSVGRGSDLAPWTPRAPNVRGGWGKTVAQETSAAGSIWKTTNQTVALCLPVKDEEAYLDEFTDYYTALGFHAIYFYDNTKSFELKQWGEEKRRLGYPVNVTHYPGETVQFRVLQACTRRAMAERHTWLAFFDVDEFLVLKKHTHIVSFLQEYCPKGALSVHWVVMGTGQREVYSPQPLTKRFTYRTRPYPNDIMKSIAVVEHINMKAQPHPHYMHLKKGYETLTTSGQICKGVMHRVNESSTDRVRNTEVAVLYHYKYKSYKEYMEKRFYRGDVRFSVARGIQQEWIKEVEKKWAPQGEDFDDAAWRAIKKILPKYRHYDELFPDPPWAQPQPSPNLSVVTRKPRLRTVALCLPVKNDDAYLDEFTDYYTALGFHAIYFYDNTKSFELKQWGEEKRRLGYPVNVTHYPGEAVQRPVLLACAKRAMAEQHTWVAFFEIDEYLVLKKHTNIVSFLQEYCPSGALSVHRVTMGTGGREVYSPQPLTKRFRYRAEFPSEQLKSIAVLKHIDMTIQPHPQYPHLKEGHTRVTTSGQTCNNHRQLVDRNGTDKTRNTDVALLYHYGSKSCKEYIHKHFPRQALTAASHDTKLGTTHLSNSTGDRNWVTGQDFDDTAWRAIKKFVEAYKHYDEIFPDLLRDGHDL